MKSFEVILAALALCSCSAQRIIAPEYLRPGDKVAIVAPAYDMPDSVVALACTRLREAGLEPVVGAHVSSQFPSSEGVSHYAGTPSERACDLMDAYMNPEIKAIICARGGYGSIQTLQKMDLKVMRTNPKWLVGYSDITALHLASVKAGVMSIHGNMCNKLAAEAAGNDSTGLIAEGNWAVLDLLMGRCGKVKAYSIDPNVYNVEGKAEGMLVGGNMITMMTLMGSEYDCFAKGDVILFIEEVEESMHAIDRLFNMLMLQNRLKNVKGIIFGDFSDCGDEFSWASVEEMLSQYTAGLGIPVCFGFPAGHGDRNLPLIEGARVTLEVSAEGAMLVFSSLPGISVLSKRL